MPSQLVTALILSDSHGILDPRVAELSRRCDIAVHAGDVMGGSVPGALQPRSGEVIAVREKNDVEHEWRGDNCSLLAGLPDRHLVDLPGGRLAVEHGQRIRDARGTHRRLRRNNRGAGAIAYGHTRERVCDTATDPWVPNPGTSGRVRTHGGPSCRMLTPPRRRWQVQEFCFGTAAGAPCTS